MPPLEKPSKNQGQIAQQDQHQPPSSVVESGLAPSKPIPTVYVSDDKGLLVRGPVRGREKKAVFQFEDGRLELFDTAEIEAMDALLKFPAISQKVRKLDRAGALRVAIAALETQRAVAQRGGMDTMAASMAYSSLAARDAELQRMGVQDADLLALREELLLTEGGGNAPRRQSPENKPLPQ